MTPHTEVQPGQRHEPAAFSVAPLDAQQPEPQLYYVVARCFGIGTSIGRESLRVRRKRKTDEQTRDRGESQRHVTSIAKK
jgi:hypothetical protein